MRIKERALALKLGPVRSAQWESIQSIEIEACETDLALPEQLKAVESTRYQMAPSISGIRQRAVPSTLCLSKVTMRQGLCTTQAMGQWNGYSQGWIEDGSTGEDSHNVVDEEDVTNIAPLLRKQAVQQFLLRGEWLIGWGWLYVFWVRRRSQRRRRQRAKSAQKERLF